MVGKSEGADEFPSQFGRYTLVQRLATGGMAEVFKAKILSAHGFEKLLVIKRILPHLAADKTFVSMFIDEAKLTAQLTHPKIVQVTDFGEEGGQYFIALEYVDGFDALALLRTSAQRQVRLPMPICLFIAHEMLDALDYAHNAKDASGKSMNIVHRDISPSNVFIAGRGDVKLGDFGIAHAKERESKTQAGTLKGKYGYMSPEQVVGGVLDGRSDLFAVGIVLAEMLMGRRLFTAPNDLDVLLMVRDGRLDRLDKYCRNLAPEADAVLRKALKKPLDERYQSAAEFRDAISELLFRMNMRVGPPDLGKLAQDYFDESSDGIARLKEHVKRWQLKPVTGPPVELTPPPVAANTAAQGQRADWGLTPQPQMAMSAESSRANASPATQPLTLGSVGGMAPRSRTIADAALVVADMAPTPAPKPVTDVKMFAALESALSQPLAIVELDQYEAPSRPTSGVPLPMGPPSSNLSGAILTPAPSTGGHAMAGSPSGAFRPATGAAPPSGGFAPVPRSSVESAGGAWSALIADRQPEDSGDLTVISPLRVLSNLAIARGTGLLHCDNGAVVKDVFLKKGTPENVDSSRTERFGDFLVSRGFLGAADLQAATSHVGRFGGKIPDVFIDLGLMKQADISRGMALFVRERVIELCSWEQGTYAWYPDVANPAESFPVAVDGFELLGAAVATLSMGFLQGRFIALEEFKPVAVKPARIPLDAFRLGTLPREVYSGLNGQRTVGEWVSKFNTEADVLTFLRILYLLTETDLARFD